MNAATNTEQQSAIVARPTQATPEAVPVLLNMLTEAEQAEVRRVEIARREAAQTERKLQPFAYD